jgi:outer membrane protein TolC
MNWKTWCAGLALLLTTAGCKQQCFLTYDDHQHYQDLAMTDKDLEFGPPPTDPVVHLSDHAPTTVNDPERKIRFISLAECIATALEQGNTGNQFIAFNIAGTGTTVSGGQLNETPATFLGAGARLNSDNIRVLSLDPAEVGSVIEQALSKFDAEIVSSANWQSINRPVGSIADTIQAGGQANFIETSAADVRGTLAKPLPTGGTAGITFDTAYQFTNLPARVNPAYTPTLTFSVEQPLLQGYGVEINQLRAAHPGAIANQQLAGLVNSTPTAQEGIVISRIRFDEQRAEFERNVTVLLTNVEIAYWRLYGSYWLLYSNEAAMRQAYEAWKIAGARLAAGRISRAEYAQARGQYELFRGQRIDALDFILENERQLRGLMGMVTEDGSRLAPSDAPTFAPYQPDWRSGLEEALRLRPELYIARQDVKVNQLNLRLQKDSLRPDVRLFANYDLNSIGTRLDGPDTNNAFRDLPSTHFHNWNVGVQGRISLGYRQAHATVRIAELNLARSYQVLQQEELKVSRFMTVSYRELTTNYEKMRSLRAQREAFADQLDAQFRIYQAGKGTLDILLEAQRFWAQALAQEYAAVVAYQQSLAVWEYAKGTILQHDNVTIADGPLPCCVATRAVENERKRTLSLVAKERPTLAAEPNGVELPTLPALWKANPPMTDAPTTIPNMPRDAAGPTMPMGTVPTMATAPSAAPPAPVAAPPALPDVTVKPAAPARANDFGVMRPFGAPPTPTPTLSLPTLTPADPPLGKTN